MKTALAALMVLAIVLCACGPTESGPPAKEIPAIEGIEMDETEAPSRFPSRP